MLNILKKYQWVTIAILIYIIGICFYAFVNHKYQSKTMYAEIDTRLLKAINGSINILTNELGDNIRGEKYIALDKERDVSFKLQEIVDLNKIAYVYTLIDDQGKLLFISSNPTPEEIRLEEEYEITYKTPYEDIDIPLRRAFSSKEVQYGVSQDQWGEFRSVYYPYKNINGDAFVVGADIYLSEVDETLLATTKKVLLTGLMLFLLGLPLLIVAARNRYKATQALEKFIYTNSVTGLNNKLKLVEAIEKKKRKYLTLVRVENYDQIVRLKGQLVADQVIRQLSNRLLAYQYPGLNFEVFHIQENVFAFLLKNELGVVDLEDAGHKLFSSLVQIGYGQNGLDEITVNVHMGTVETDNDVLELANMALYEAAEKNLSMVMYNDESDLPQHYNDDLNNNRLLVEAIQNNNLVAHYQPIFDVKTNRVIRYEALARLVDGDNVILYPNKFIEIANKSRLIHKITKVILDDVIDKIKDTNIHVSINISAHDLEDKQTTKYICEVIEKHGIGSQLSFELLEDQIITDYELIKDSLNKISALGCKIGLDDLGKHYSNFDRLLSLPLDFIKIDGAIISQITDKKEIINLVNDIVSFAKEKNLVTIAEFCSNQEIYNMVSALGIDEAQGFYLGKPQREFIS